MRTHLPKPSPAMVVACLALFVSLTGTSIAASHYLITSTKQIKPSVLKQLKGAQGPRGYQGAQGAQGAQGSPGPNGNPGATHVVIRTAIGRTDSNVSSASVNCQTGEVATGGGVGWDTATTTGSPYVVASGPMGTFGWFVIVDNAIVTGSTVVTAQAYVTCASP